VFFLVEQEAMLSMPVKQTKAATTVFNLFNLN
jgi:hypothetical protein